MDPDPLSLNSVQKGYFNKNIVLKKPMLFLFGKLTNSCTIVEYADNLYKNPLNII